MPINSSPILLAFAGVPGTYLRSPVITSFTPSIVTIGSGLIVLGQGFFGATEIRINGLALNNFIEVSDTALFGTIPWGAESGAIEVINPMGIDTSLTNCVVDPDNIYEFFRLYAQPEEFLFNL